ncbi:MAG: bifunctional riboflavin kinase/FAD synthetase [Anaerolineales bacterium]|nr:bifunctional riboflavin kinase/FAD synthetase [Anaerolineales bacterium]
MVQHYHSTEEIRIDASWLTIGVFDGVHLGHQALVKQLTAGAQQANVPAVVLTFYPHPAVALGKRSKMDYLTMPDEKVEILGALGVDIVITEAFTREMSRLSAGEFMEHLHRRLGLKHLLVGYDFALGKDRSGDITHLKELGQAVGYRVQALPAVRMNGETVSSRHIRSRLADGHVEKAAEWMGRYYAVSGTVVHGDGRGRKISIPTANIDYLPGKIIPKNGVYVCWAWVREKRYPAVTNIGIRPTFTTQETEAQIEAHILDFDREIYDQQLKLEFVERLRGEKKFLSVEELIAQIDMDIEKSRRILENDISS